ncbi:MAG: FAD-dependent oxidoreductase [Planctomycetaceae bacterium]
MTDVVVVGGGVIGLSIAWELVRHGVSVKNC